MFTFWFDVNVGTTPIGGIELFKPDPAADVAGLFFAFPPTASLSAKSARPSDQPIRVPVTLVRATHE